jgi:hypothetical protein
VISRAAVLTVAVTGAAALPVAGAGTPTVEVVDNATFGTS